MKSVLTYLLLFLFVNSLQANDAIEGKWRGTIVGHVDDRDYFIHAEIAAKKREGEFTIKMKLFSEDYTGEFLLQTEMIAEKLYIRKLEKIAEFPYPYLHIEDCFTGYFLLKKSANNKLELDLYRNPVYHKIEEFTNLDGDGNFSPGFQCFTTVVLRSKHSDTTFNAKEKRSDSLVSAKKIRADEVLKRKQVSTKTWTVKKNKIVLQVWDNNKEDGDIISLKFNDKWILTDFLLKKEKHTIPLTLNKKENQLLLFAENLGSITPNTAAVSIDDNVLVRTFILNSDMNKSETIKISLADTKVK